MSNYRFPQLSTLEVLTKNLKPSLRQILSNTALISCQHLLETTGSLFECLFHNGLKPQFTFILGKMYSTNHKVAVNLRDLGCHVINGSTPKLRGTYNAMIEVDSQNLWKLAEKRINDERVGNIIILDDGACVGRFTANIFKEYSCKGKVVGIEQTTSGMPWWNTQYPVINVASSAAKRYYEPPLVAKAVWHRVKSLCQLHPNNSHLGIVGLGKIGKALFELLYKEGFLIFGYDIDNERLKPLRKLHKCSSVSELIQKSDLIFGCTGNDSIPIDGFFTSQGIKTFASCSSSDVEFRSLLLDQRIPWKPIQKKEKKCPILEAHYPDRKLIIRILRSGYPVNFDNSPESIPKEEIQLTRGLLFGAIFQALDIITNLYPLESGTIMLSPKIQQIVVKGWFTQNNKGKIPEIDWFYRESRGKAINCAPFEY